MTNIKDMSVDELSNNVGRTLTARDVFDELARRYQATHSELLAIHTICLCIAECPPESEVDTWTVKAVKQMATRLSTCQKELAEAEKRASRCAVDYNELNERFEKAEAIVKALDSILNTLEGSNRTNTDYSRGWDDAINSVRTNLDAIRKKGVK